MADNDSDFLGGLLDVLFRLSSLHPPQVKAGGYSEDIFCSLSEGEKEEFTCAICYQILKDVRQCVNKHKFCAPCIYVWSTGANSVNRSRCPVCRTHGFYLRDLVLDNKIQTKQVTCRLKACGWSGKLKHLASHRHLNYGSTVGGNLPTGLPVRSGSRLQVLPRIDDAESMSPRQQTTRLSGLETLRPSSQSRISPNMDNTDQTTTHSLLSYSTNTNDLSPMLLSVGSLNPLSSSDRLTTHHSLVPAPSPINHATSSLRRSRIRLNNSTDVLTGRGVDNSEPNTPLYEPSMTMNQLLNRHTQTNATTTSTASTMIPHPPSTTRPTASQSRRMNRTNIRPSLYLSPGTTPRPNPNRLSGTAPHHVTTVNDPPVTSSSSTGGVSNTINTNTTSNGTNSNTIINSIATSLNNNSGDTGTNQRSTVLSNSLNDISNSLTRPTVAIIGANSNTSAPVTDNARNANTRPIPESHLVNSLNSSTSSSVDNVSANISTNLRVDEDTRPRGVQTLSTVNSDRYRLRQRVQDNRNRLATFQESLDGRRRQVEEFQDELERMRMEQLTEVRQVWQRLGQLTQELREILDVQRSDLVNLSETDNMADDSHDNDHHDNEGSG